MIYLVLILIMTAMYSMLWLDMAHKIKNTLTDLLSAKVQNAFDIKFNFSSYQIKNFPFDIEIYFNKPELSIQYTVDVKNKVAFNSNVLKVKYPLFSSNILLFMQNFDFKNDDKNITIGNIKQPFIIDIPLFKNDKNKYKIKYIDDSVSINSLSTDNASENITYSVDSNIDINVENKKDNNIIDVFIKFSDNNTKIPFMEYDFGINVESSNITTAAFYIKKFFNTKSNCCGINANGKFELKFGQSSEIEYDGNVEIFLHNYKKMIEHFESLNTDVPELNSVTKFVHDTIVAAADEIINDDLKISIYKKENLTYFGKLSVKEFMNKYSQHFPNSAVNNNNL